MRVSPVAYLFEDLEKVQQEALKATIPSHDSKQAIKGAQCLASAIYLARKKHTKEEIKEYIMQNYNYQLDYNLEELQESNTFDGTSEKTVPQAIFLFLQSHDFEDSIRKAISIGGDTDTISCMVGSISEEYYGIPKELRNKALERLPCDLRDVIVAAYYKKKSNILEEQKAYERV